MFSPDEHSHKQDLFKVFQALSVCNLKLKRSKCEFFQEQVPFLGGFIFKHGHAICPDKVKAIVDMAPPNFKTGVKSFLGSVNFLQRFCKDLSGVALPFCKTNICQSPICLY